MDAAVLDRVLLPVGLSARNDGGSLVGLGDREIKGVSATSTGTTGGLGLPVVVVVVVVVSLVLVSSGCRVALLGENESRVTDILLFLGDPGMYRIFDGDSIRGELSSTSLSDSEHDRAT